MLGELTTNSIYAFSSGVLRFLLSLIKCRFQISPEATRQLQKKLGKFACGRGSAQTPLIGVARGALGERPTLQGEKKFLA